MVRPLPAVLLALGLAAASPATALTVSLAPGAGASEIEARTFDTDFFCCTFTHAVLGPPDAGQLTVSPLINPPFEATVDYAISDAGFSFDWVTVRTDDEDDSASVQAEIFFSVDEAVGYAFSGSYALVDPDGHIAFLDAELEDLTAASILYQTAYHNSGAPNATLVLDDPTFQVVDSGSPTGTLTAGHEYRFRFLASSDVFGGPPVGDGTVATGAGDLTLAFVPEPVPALLLLSTLPALCYGARPWRRSPTR